MSESSAATVAETKTPKAKSTASKTRRGLPSKRRMRHSPHFVDELAQRNEVSIGRMIALSSIEPDPNQPRSQFGDLAELTQSIRDKGVLEPILVRRIADGGDADGGYRIISGERRYRASLEAGLPDEDDATN